MHGSVLITGGAGFVGSHLARRVKETWPAARVRALDNLRRSGSEDGLRRLREAGIEFIHGDVRWSGDLAAAAGDVRLIVECSAEPSAQAGYGSDPEYAVHTNLVGCWNCLELARRRRAAFLFVSSSRVYPYATLNRLRYSEDETRFRLEPLQSIAGASERGISEDFPLEGPRSIYGTTKLASELMLEEYGDAYGLQWVIDRCGVIAGPGQRGKSDQGVMAYWMAAHYSKRPLRYIGFGGAGKQVRDVLHIEDFADLVVDQIAHFDQYEGQVFNVGGGQAFSLSLAETTALCRAITGNRVPLRSAAENRPADVRIYTSDNTRVAAVRGWQPKRPAAATLQDIYEWVRGNDGDLLI